MRHTAYLFAAGLLAMAMVQVGCDLTCDPTCPSGSTCRDRDGVGAPECVTPEGELACAGDSHCPADGDCMDGLCSRRCGCATDNSCTWGDICVTEDEGCGLCMSTDDRACDRDADCLAVVDASNCCRCPRSRNRTAAEADPCLVEFPQTGPPPVGCQPDCGGVDHCWPCDDAPIEVTCDGGAHPICHI